jgi:NADH:ubiquinone oxidoreductase subunit 2 (subunit N)
MEQAKSLTEYRILWWLSLLAIFNGVVMVIHYECFVKPDYWNPEDKQQQNTHNKK